MGGGAPSQKQGKGGRDRGFAEGTPGKGITFKKKNLGVKKVIF